MNQDLTGPLSDLLFQRAARLVEEPRAFAAPQDNLSLTFSLPDRRHELARRQPAISE